MRLPILVGVVTLLLVTAFFVPTSLFLFLMTVSVVCPACIATKWVFPVDRTVPFVSSLAIQARGPPSSPIY